VRKNNQFIIEKKIKFNLKKLMNFNQFFLNIGINSQKKSLKIPLNIRKKISNQFFPATNAGSPSDPCVPYDLQFAVIFKRLTTTINDICDESLANITDYSSANSNQPFDEFEVAATSIAGQANSLTYAQIFKAFEEISIFIPGTSIFEILSFFTDDSSAFFPLDCFTAKRDPFNALISDCFVRITSYIDDLTLTHPL
jgi:hypothetical protein